MKLWRQGDDEPGGQRAAEREAALWRHQDHLGSARLRTDGTGAPIGDSLYKPFGEEVLTPPNQPASLDNYRFTGQERDRETDLDNFKARIYSWEAARFCRWIRPLRPSILRTRRPGTGHSYVLNNPVKFVDPDGRAAVAAAARDGAVALAGLSAVVPGLQPVALGLAGTAVALTIVQNREEIGAAITTAVDNVAGLFSSPGGAVAEADLSIPGLAPVAAHSMASFSSDGSADGGGQGPKDTAEMADDLANKLGRNRVSGRTAGGQKIDIDLSGRGHHDKASGQRIETPHVHGATINVGPNGKVNLSNRTIKPASKQDIRTAKRLGGG